MTIQKLAHYSIRTTNLEASLRFYTDVIGLRNGYRPPFKFPGNWLYVGDDESDQGVVHLLGVNVKDSKELVEAAGYKDPSTLHGSGAVDHVAFFAVNLADMRARLKSLSITFRERTVPDLHVHQIFLDDPSGFTVELNYPANEVAKVIP